MPQQVIIDTANDPKRHVIKMFNDLKRQFDRIDWKPFLRNQIHKLEFDHRKYFEKAMGPDKQKWKKLDPSTVRKKGSDRILIDRKRLMRSLSRTTGDSVREIIGNSLLFGTKVPYSSFLQKRQSRKKRATPARRHVGIMDQRANQIAEDAADHVVAELMK